MVSVAKAKAARTAALAVQEGVQMHGGIGMTDEHDIGFYMKREAVLAELFGPRFTARGRSSGLLARRAENDPRRGDRPPARPATRRLDIGMRLPAADLASA